MNYTVEQILEIENKKEIILNHPLSTRIDWAKEGIFSTILVEDPSWKVRVEVAKNSGGEILEILKEDHVWQVKLEVLKSTSLSFMNISNMDEENINIIEEAIKQGYSIEELDYEDNEAIKLLILKYKGLKFAEENGLILNFYDENLEIQKEMINQGHSANYKKLSEEVLIHYINKLPLIEELTNIYSNTKFKSVKIAAIMNGYLVQNQNNETFLSLFENFDFIKFCIQNNRYIDIIIKRYYKRQDVLAELIFNGYSSEPINFTLNKKQYNYTVSSYAQSKLNFDIFKAILKINPKDIYQINYLTSEMFYYLCQNTEDSQLINHAKDLFQKKQIKLTTISNQNVIHI